MVQWISHLPCQPVVAGSIHCSTSLLDEGQRDFCHGSSSVVRASVNSFLVSAIETIFHNQSGQNLQEVYIGTRSRMSSIVSEIRPVTSELLPLKY